VSDVLDDDATYPREDIRNKSCVSGLWNLENDTTHGQTGSTTPHQTAGRPNWTNQVSAWQAELERRPIRLGVSARMSRGCYEETAPVEFQLY